MKALLAVAVLMLTSIAWSYEIVENPDRKVSVGINFIRHSLSGDYNSNELNFKLLDAGSMTQNDFLADLRVPVSSVFTFSLGGGFSKQTLGLSIFAADEQWDMSGYKLNFGVRAYFP